jgi:hypothetical protein
VPYWTTFPVEPSADGLEHYLDQTDPYDHLHLTMFCHGVRSVGAVPADRWRTLLRRARVAGHFTGVAPDRYPADLAAFFTFPHAVRRIPARHPMPTPLPARELDDFLAGHGNRYPTVAAEALS